MPTRPDLKAIFSLASVAFSAAVFRVVPESMREKILSTEGNRFYPGRYHNAGETGILYTSMSQKTATRELGRHASQSGLQGGLAIGRVRVKLQKVLDLTNEANLRKLGISPMDIISSNYSLTQALSLLARKARFQGLIVSSAAGEGKNLIIFENNLAEGCLINVETILSLPDSSA